MAVEPEALLVTRGLTVILGDRVIGPIDMHVAPGEIVALRGPNGCGKTTTIRASLGLLRATQGAAFVRGSEVDPFHPPRGVGYLPDAVEFWAWLNGRDNLAAFAAGPTDVDEALATVGLSDVGNLAVRRYSRGMAQRLGIARAIVGAPDLVVMDEPTIALDADALDFLERILKQCATEGRGVFIASHDAPFVERIATTVIDLKPGAVTR